MTKIQNLERFEHWLVEFAIYTACHINVPK
jgi:hypothetical protein